MSKRKKMIAIVLFILMFCCMMVCLIYSMVVTKQVKELKAQMAYLQDNPVNVESLAGTEEIQAEASGISTKDISYEAYDVGSALLLDVRNDSNEVENGIDMMVIFYDKNKKAITTAEGYTGMIFPDDHVITAVSIPLDGSGNKIAYDHVEVKMTLSPYASSYVSYVKDISLNSTQDVNLGLITTCTNTAAYDISDVDVTALYYKDGKVVGYAIGYAGAVTAGEDAVVQLTPPYDENGNVIQYDDCEVFVNAAY